MRPIVVGLFLAALAAAFTPIAAFAATPPPAAKPPVVAPEARTKGMAAAPALISSIPLDCQLADARFIGTSADPATKTPNNLYELACTGSEGFIVVAYAAPKPLPGVYTCLEIAGQPQSGLKCLLPGNANAAQGLAPLTAKYQPDCALKDARAVGQTTDRTTTEFEISCQDGRGFIVDTSFPMTIAKKATFVPCLAYTGDQANRCQLTDATAQAAWLGGMVSKMGKPCDVKDHRFIGASDTGSVFYEVACNDGKGYVIQVDSKGAVQPGIDCAIADNIGGGCQLTNARQAQSAQNDLYTKAAKASGFNCTVSKYSPFDVNVPGHDVVELACSNRPDGGVGIFPADVTQPGVVYDCIHAPLAGYRCSFTDPNAAVASLTADLAKLGKSDCVASAQRFMADTQDNKGFVEVACADGNPGFVVEYSTTPTVTPTEATACAFAKGVLEGCTMPQNKPKPH
jgi:hypothetical protein